MSPIRSSNRQAATEEPTPKPASAVNPIASAERLPEASRRVVERSAALLEYFSNPPPPFRELDEAWEEAIALYGDEDSDAWVSALEDGTHPLCRVGALARPS